MKYKIPAVAAVVMMGLDYLTTRIILAHGGIEMSPFVNFTGLWLAKLVCLIIIGLLYKYRRARALRVIVYFYIVIISNNLYWVYRIYRS